MDPRLRTHLDHDHGMISARAADSFTVHRCPGQDALGRHGMVRTVVPAVAVLGTAMTAGVRSGVMAADAALRRATLTTQELEDWVDRFRRVPGVARARYVVAKASGLAESPGESLLRLVLIGLGHDFLEQHRIPRPGGRLARVDFYLPGLDVVVEFDGMVKYGGCDAQAELAAEESREDDIRALGRGVARVVWADAARSRGGRS